MTRRSIRVREATLLAVLERRRRRRPVRVGYRELRPRRRGEALERNRIRRSPRRGLPSRGNQGGAPGVPDRPDTACRVAEQRSGHRGSPTDVVRAGRTIIPTHDDQQLNADSTATIVRRRRHRQPGLGSPGVRPRAAAAAGETGPGEIAAGDGRPLAGVDRTVHRADRHQRIPSSTMPRSERRRRQSARIRLVHPGCSAASHRPRASPPLQLSADAEIACEPRPVRLCGLNIIGNARLWRCG